MAVCFGQLLVSFQITWRPLLPTNEPCDSLDLTAWLNGIESQAAADIELLPLKVEENSLILDIHKL